METAITTLRGEPSVSLDALADRVRKEHAEARASSQNLVTHAIEAGRLLKEAKNRVPHGSWLTWPEKNCELSERTAQAYMRLAKKAQLEANP
jgi:hypothetical protein